MSRLSVNPAAPANLSSDQNYQVVLVKIFTPINLFQNSIEENKKSKSR
jgi:hypothetical protein